MKFFRTFLAALLAVVVGSFMMGFLWILALVGIAGTMESTTAVQPESVLVINLDEEMLDAGSIKCPDCGEELEFDAEDLEDEEPF